MSSDYKAKLTEAQQEILAGIPCVSQQAFSNMAMGHTQNETTGDSSDIGYILNTIHSHASMLHQQADYWKRRAIEAEDNHVKEIVRRTRYQDALAEIEAMAPPGSPIELLASEALERPKKSQAEKVSDQ